MAKEISVCSDELKVVTLGYKSHHIKPFFLFSEKFQKIIDPISRMMSSLNILHCPIIAHIVWHLTP